MNNFTTRLARITAFGVFAGVLASSSAWAIDAKAFIDRYAKFAADQGQTFTYDGIDGSGETFTVTNPAWTLPQMAPIKSDTAVFNNVEESAEGAVTIGSIEIGQIQSGSGDVSVTFDSATMKNLQIPKDGETDPLKKIMYYQSFETGPGSVMYGGKEVASMKSSDIKLSPYSTSAPITMSMAMNEIAFDLTAIPDPNVQQTLAGFGYDGKFTGRIVLDGNWSMETGILELGTYDIVVDKVGTLSFPFTITGYTAERVIEMQKTSKALNEMTDTAEQERLSMEMFSTLGIGKGTIRFTDDSFTNRALDFASKQMGQPKEQLAAGAPFMIGAAMGQLQMPELTQTLSQAVGKFLQDPKSISISVDPKEPKSLGELIAAGQTNPKGLVEDLNLTVTAE